MVFYFTPRGSDGKDAWIIYMASLLMHLCSRVQDKRRPPLLSRSPAAASQTCRLLACLTQRRSGRRHTVAAAAAAAAPASHWQHRSSAKRPLRLQHQQHTAPNPFEMQGLDKYENEDLIKYSLPHDVWFHVDALSSAHVYLRPPEGALLLQP